jgi:hypothetical protein
MRNDLHIASFHRGRSHPLLALLDVESMWATVVVLVGSKNQILNGLTSALP